MNKHDRQKSSNTDIELERNNKLNSNISRIVVITINNEK